MAEKYDDSTLVIQSENKLSVVRGPMNAATYQEAPEYSHLSDAQKKVFDKLVTKEGPDALVLIQTNYTDSTHKTPTDTLLFIGKAATGAHMITGAHMSYSGNDYVQFSKIFNPATGNSTVTGAEIEAPSSNNGTYLNQHHVTYFTDSINSSLKSGAISRGEPAKDAASLAAALAKGTTSELTSVVPSKLSDPKIGLA